METNGEQPTGAFTGSTPSILVIDDEEPVREVLRALLLSRGFGVTTAEDGIAALEALERDPNHDAVLSDLNMPRMDGLALLERAARRAPDVPFIVLTGTQEFESARKALQRGAYDFLSKPIDTDALLSALRRAVETRRLRRRVRRVVADLADSNARLKALDRANRTLLGLVVAEVDDPVTALAAQLEHLRSGLGARLEDEPRGLLEAALENARRAARAVGNVADIHLLTHGETHLRKDPVDVVSLLEREIPLAREAAARRRGSEPSQLRAMLEPSHIRIVEGDADLLARIIEAALRFAFLRTPLGETVCIRGVDGGDRDRTVLLVEDRGAHLSRDTREQLLAPGEPSDLVAAGIAHDLPLALPLAALAARAHGGRVTIEARDGGGAAIRVDLPARRR